MIKTQIKASAIAFAACSSIFAAKPANLLVKMTDSLPPSHFATLTLAPEWMHSGKASTISLLPPFSNHYTVDNTWDSEGALGIAAGWERTFNQQFAYQLGIAGYFHTSNDINGHVWQFALPDFDNLIYHYRVQSNQLMVTGKLLGSFKQTLHPYIAGEVGAAFNRASTYNEIPIIFEAIPMPAFANHTESSFSYGVGIGMDIDINTTMRLGVGYQFADLGKVELGRSAAQVTQETLHFSHLYSHQLRMQLTALI